MNENIIKSSETSYSGTLIKGWNEKGSYNRIQYFSKDIHTYATISELMDEGLQKMQTRDDKDLTRLDIRVDISRDDDNVIKELQKLENTDCSIKNFNGTEKSELIIGKNGIQREISKNNIIGLQNYINDKIHKSLNILSKYGGFEKYALEQLKKIKELGYKFENKNFTEDEIYDLWNESFGWKKNAIKNILLSDDNNIFGLRNNNGELVSLVLISDGETTEWMTRKDLQGNGLIEPLLIFSNSFLINLFGKEKSKIYVQARHDRSIGPSVKTGMNFNTNNNLQFVLTNHVEIEGKYQSFAEGVLDTNLYTDKIIENYLNYY